MAKTYTEIKTEIANDITSKTAKKSITKTSVGGAIGDVLDYAKNDIEELRGVEDKTITDYGDYTCVSGYQLLDNGSWYAGDNYKFALIPITTSNSVKIFGAVGGTCFYSFLKSYNGTSTSADVCQSFKDGNSGKCRATLKSKEYVVLVAPNDAMYLYVTIKLDATNNRAPQYVSIPGKDGALIEIEGKKDVVINTYDNYETQSCQVVDSGKWSNYGNPTSVIIPILSNVVKIQNSNIRTIYYSLLKADGGISNGETAKICDGCEPRYTIESGKSVTFTIANDCQLISITTNLNSTQCAPAYVKFIGAASLKDIKPNSGKYAELYGDQIADASNTLCTNGVLIRKVESSFIHISDMHGDLRAANVAGYVADKLNFYAPILNTGDIVYGEPKDNGEVSTDVVKYMEIAKKYGIFHIAGQHEVGFTNDAVGGGKFNGKLKSCCMSHDEYYNTFICPMKNIWGITSTTPYYYKDFDATKTRLIALYQYNCPITDDPTDSTKYLYDRGKCWYGQSQIDWFVNLLLNAQSGWKIIVMMHECDGTINYIDNTFRTKSTSTGSSGGKIINGSPIFDIIDAFVSRGAINKTYHCTDTDTYPTDTFELVVNTSFASAVATFGCALGGDWHFDHIGTFGINKLIYKGITASGRQCTDCYVDGSEMDNELPNNCIVDACGLSSNDMSIVRIGQRSSVLMQDRSRAIFAIKQ